MLTKIIFMAIITSGPFLAAAITLWISFRIFNYKDKKRKGEKFSLSLEVLYNLFFLYVLGVIEVTIFPIFVGTFSENNFTLFSSIPKTIHYFYHPSLFKNVVGNIALFIPLGILVPLIWKNINNFGKIFLVALTCSFAIEFLQFTIFVHRVSNIDDIILNISGALMGYLILKISLMIGRALSLGKYVD